MTSHPYFALEIAVEGNHRLSYGDVLEHGRSQPLASTALA